MTEVVFYIDDENDHLTVEVGGMRADLEENLSFDDMVKLRKNGIDPFIIFEKILTEIDKFKKEHPESNEVIGEIKDYDDVLTKIFTFFTNIFSSSLSLMDLDKIKNEGK